MSRKKRTAEIITTQMMLLGENSPMYSENNGLIRYVKPEVGPVYIIPGIIEPKEMKMEEAMRYVTSQGKRWEVMHKPVEGEKR